MNEKMESSCLNNTWTLVCRFVGSRLVNCKWILKCKEGNPYIRQQKLYKIGG